MPIDPICNITDDAEFTPSTLEASVPLIRKYQVFLSSSYEDLTAEREAVTWGLLSNRYIPAGMENFTASSNRGWDVMARVIELSDYFVLIIAGRHGSIDPETGLSWTEREFDYAQSIGVPVLAFVRQDSHISANMYEKDHGKIKELQRFIASVQDTHLCETWTTTESLVHKVTAALRNQIEDDEASKREREGWYRGPVPPHGHGNQILRKAGLRDVYSDRSDPRFIQFQNSLGRIKQLDFLTIAGTHILDSANGQHPMRRALTDPDTIVRLLLLNPFDVSPAMRKRLKYERGLSSKEHVTKALTMFLPRVLVTRIAAWANQSEANQLAAAQFYGGEKIHLEPLANFHLHLYDEMPAVHMLRVDSHLFTEQYYLANLGDKVLAGTDLDCIGRHFPILHFADNEHLAQKLVRSHFERLRNEKETVDATRELHGATRSYRANNLDANLIRHFEPFMRDRGS